MSDEMNFDKEILDKHKANLEREKTNNEVKIAYHEKLLQLLYKDRDARLANYRIMADNMQPVNAHWAYELVPEFQANLKNLQEVMIVQEEEKYKLNEEQILKAIEVGKEQLESIISELERLNNEEVGKDE